jgi:outer membrane lipoprotein SlyB
MNLPTSTTPSHTNKPLWAAIAVLGVAVLAMGVALIRTQSQAVKPGTSVLPAAMAGSDTAAAPTGPTVATPADTATALPALAQSVPSAPPTKNTTHTKNGVAAQVNQASNATKTAANQVSETDIGPRVVLPQNPEPAVARVTAPARATCANCGKVESVTPVELDGAGTGAGAIAGGVLGAVVGNQVGGGNGKAVATILGAVGGGMAGNTVEKKMKKTTQFDVLVRMDDGSHRTLRQATPPAVGSSVVVNGDSMQPASQ